MLIWEYEAAKVIKDNLWLPEQKKMRDNYVGDLSYFFGGNGKLRDYLGIFEFFLLLIEKDFPLDEISDSDRNDMQELMIFAFSGMPHLRSRIWTALPKTSGSFQQDFIEWIKDKDHILQFDNEREFFDYINFFLHINNSPGKH